jgi:hypothetical protein
MSAGVDQYVTEAGLIKERVTTTVTPDTSPTISTVTKQNGSTYSYYTNSIAYEATSGYYVRGRIESVNLYPVVESGTWGSLTAGITWNTPTILSSNVLRGSQVKVATGGGYAHLAYCTRENSNENAKVTPVAISGSGSLSLGTTTTVNTLASSGSSTEPYGIEYDTSQNTILAFFYLGWASGYLNKVFPLQMSGSNYSYSSSDAVTLTSGIDVYMKSLNTVFDPDTNRTIAFYNVDGVSVNGIVLSCSGTSITKGATQSPSLTAPVGNGWTSVAYDTQNNKIIFMYAISSYKPKYSIVTVTGGGTNTLSFTSDAYAFANTSQQAEACAITWNGDANRLFMVYPKYADSHVQCNTFTSNGSTLTTITQEEISTEEMKNSGGTEEDATVFVTGKGVSYSLGDSDTSPGILNFTLSLGSITSTNLTSSSYLGVASTSASASASVNINIPRSINNNQTSLTVGEYYYTSGNGVISTTFSPNFIGRAISSTQLLLEEEAGNSIVGFSNGAITKGKPVVMQADGDVAQAGVVASAISPGLGSIATELGYASYNSTAFGKDGQRVTAYRGAELSSNVYNIYLRVATTSTADLKTITWSGVSTLTPSSAGNMRSLGIVYDTVADKYVLVWKGASDYIHGCTLTVSGTGATASVSAGTNIVINSDGMTGYLNDNSLCYDTTNNFSIVSWSYSTPKTCSLSISGTNLTAGTTYTLSNNTTNELTVCAYNKYHEKVIYMYTNQSTEDLYYNVGTPNSNGTITVSAGNENVFDNVVNYSTNVTVVSCNVSSGETLVVIQDGDNRKGQGAATVWGSSGTLSGTTITFGALTQISNIVGMGNTYNGRVLKPIEDNKFIYATSTQTSSPTLPYRGVYSIITVSGTSTSYGTVTAYSPQYTYGINSLSVGVDFAKTQAVIVWQDEQSGEQDLRGITLLQSTQNGQAPNLTTENYLGIASDTVADNKNVLIDTQGAANPDQSSLTPAQLYYVQTNGTLSTTAGSPSVVAGIATSATTLLITRS